MALYLSELHLYSSRFQRARLHHIYTQHLEIYQLFDNIRKQQGQPDNAHSGILWVDKGGTSNSRRFLILSNRPPRADNSQHIICKPVSDHFSGYSRYRFTVVINPVRRQCHNKKLHPIKSRHEISSWFCQQAEQQWGFAVSRPHLQIDDISVRQFYKTTDPDEIEKRQAQNIPPVTLQQATLSGFFNVTDPSRFHNSFIHGIGKGRSFGCGLLQIVPVLPSPFNQQDRSQ